jgi:DNA-binding transcriptional ArsR family regulator
MGLRNVRAAMLTSDKVPLEVRWTLVALAALTYDAPQYGQEPRLYFGGWQRVVIASGGYPDDVSKRRFMRHVKTLREAGIVQVVEPGYPGHNAVYRLVLAVDNSVDSVDNDE